MLIDHGERGRCLYVILNYPEASPKEGLSGRIESREYSRPTLFFYSRATHATARGGRGALWRRNVFHLNTDLGSTCSAEPSIDRSRAAVDRFECGQRLARAFVSLSSRPARAGVAPTAVAGCRAGPKLEATRSEQFPTG